MDNGSAEPDSEAVNRLTWREIEPLVLEFIATLSERQLARIYWCGARLWMDTFDAEIRITLGHPHYIVEHVNDEAAIGQWVWFDEDVSVADEHPVDEEGGRVDDWPELADWMRDDLEYRASWIAEKLGEAVLQLS